MKTTIEELKIGDMLYVQEYSSTYELGTYIGNGLCKMKRGWDKNDKVISIERLSWKYFQESPKKGLFQQIKDLLK